MKVQPPDGPSVGRTVHLKTKEQEHRGPLPAPRAPPLDILSSIGCHDVDTSPAQRTPFCSHIPRIIASLVLAGSAFAVEAATHRYSKQVQRACANDYRAYCGEYGLETNALRGCMSRAGKRLSHACINALVASGEVSRAEVKRRKRLRR
jgi:hypothetical protein